MPCSMIDLRLLRHNCSSLSRKLRDFLCGSVSSQQLLCSVSGVKPSHRRPSTGQSSATGKTPSQYQHAFPAMPASQHRIDKFSPELETARADRQPVRQVAPIAWMPFILICPDLLRVIALGDSSNMPCMTLQWPKLRKICAHVSSRSWFVLLPHRLAGQGWPPNLLKARK